MPDLVGTAEIRVDMNTRDAARSIRAMVSRSDGPLRTFKDRIGDVGQELERVRAVARDITITADLDNRLTAGATAVRDAVNDLQRLGPVRIPAEIDDDTGPGMGRVRASVDRLRQLGAVRIPAVLDDVTAAGATAVRSTVARLQGLGPVTVPVQVDDDTGAGAAAVRAAVARLEGLGPIRIAVDVDARAADLASAAQAMGTLQQRATTTSRALTSLATRATAAAAALTAVKEAAQDAGRALRTLRGRVQAAADAMGNLRTSAAAAATTLRTITNRADGANQRLGDLGGSTRTLRSDMDDLDGSLTRVGGRLGGLRGRLGTLGNSAGGAGDRMKDVTGALMSLGLAAIPVAASIAPIAAAAGAAGLAVAAFGAAAAGQVAALSKASEAETKYKDAVKEHGRTSQQAAEASSAYARTMSQLPAPTRTAAAALSSLKATYTGWSNALARDTMPVFTRGLQTVSAVLPKLNPLVRTAAAGFNRLITIAAGGIASPGMDALIQKVNTLAGGALRRATDGLLSFIRSAQSGAVGGNVTAFMAYARANGPLVGETLRNLGSVLMKLLSAAADAGVGMLSVVNAFASLVNAIPQGLLSNLVQVYVAFRLIKLAGVGMVAMNAGLAAVAGHITAMRTAAAGATGRMASLRAGLAAMPGGAKFALAAIGVAVLTVGISKLVSKLDEAPPSAEKLSQSMVKFARTGRIGGEAARAFGKDLGGFGDAVARVGHPSVMERIKDVGHTIVTLGMDTEAGLDKAQKGTQAVDKSLADLVSKGHSDIAAVAFRRYAKAAEKGGTSTDKLRGMLPKYKEALANAKMEQELVAQSMGLFGSQAMKTKNKLEAQKASADGLRQAIQALNDVNRAGLGGMIGFEAAIDAATKAAKDNAGALSMSGGRLNLNSEKARAGATALNDLAQKTDEAAGSARESGKSWSTVSGIYERGRQALVRNAMQMGLTRAEATKLAGQILKIPNKKTTLKGDVTDLSSKIAKAKAQLSDKNIPKEKRAKLTADIKRWNNQLAVAKARLLMTPTKREAKLTGNIKDWRAKIAAAEKQLKTAKGTKRAKLTGDIKDWKAKVSAAERQLKRAKATKTAKLSANIRDWTSKLEAAKRRLKSVPASKRSALRATIADLQSKVSAAKRAINSVKGKTVTIRTNYVTSRKATKGATFGQGGSYYQKNARGGPIRRLASGGPVQGFPGGGLLRGPGTGTSDSIPLLGSAGEYMVKARAVDKYGEPFMESINSMQLPVGTATSAGRSAGRGGASTVVNNYYNVQFTNEGPIGSQQELDDWLTSSMDRLKQQRRLPIAVGGR
ncbi:hypothetical protein [Streptomyces iconiensis]|uniref:Uncharacterized protein n=1 Tax=Streptomyces iconiensis TaxID=1384038 RepID=A0ABT7A997_9ACTN|nr:hypothetical protein [Streptomyces iconiensis]MDJ1137929.1 hypothetical protein [Streptomyces iconiensis]